MVKTPIRFSAIKIILITLAVLLFIGSIAAAIVFYKKYQDLKQATPEQLQSQQTDAYIAEIGKLYALPGNEKPTVLTVKDDKAQIDQLKQSYPFFGQAQAGDIALVYQEAKLAILYRPSTKQLINVGTVNIEQQLAIRTVGEETARKAVEQKLTEVKQTFTSGGETKTTIEGIKIVDVKGGKTEQAKALAELLGGDVVTLPEGEDKPDDTDILVLVGGEAEADPSAMTP